VKDRLKQNLDSIKEKKMQEDDLDWVWINTGGEGKGKSAFSIALADYLDPDFSTDQIVFSGEEFISKAQELEDYRPIILDEGIEDLYSRNAMTKKNKNLVQFLRQCRALHKFIIINIPNITELDKSIRTSRANTVSRCVSQGWAWIYRDGQIQNIEEDRNGSISWPEPVLKSGWQNPENSMPELWKDYKEKKRDVVKSLGSEAVEEEDINWISAGKAADMVGVNRKTIGNWRKDGVFEEFSKLPNGDYRYKEKEIKGILEKN